MFHTICNDGTTFTINYLNDQLELRDERIRELEAKIVGLERKMSALSETIGDWNCTSIGSDSRFSHFSGFTVGEELNFVGQGRHGGDKVGDEEEDSGNGDQKRNAHKRKHAPEGQEGKRDNEEDENGDDAQKPKARKKQNGQKGDQISDAKGGQFSYYRKDFQHSRRSNLSRSERRSNGAHAGLINSDVIRYSNAIFQCIASCANSGYCDDFLRSLPSEEHQHFKLYYEFKSVISSILGNGMDNIDPHKFIDLYKEHYNNFSTHEDKWHGNFIKQ